MVSRNGKPLVRITQLEEPKRRIKFGVLKGKVTIAADFDAPLPDGVLAGFEGRLCESCWIRTSSFGPSPNRSGF